MIHYHSHRERTSPIKEEEQGRTEDSQSCVGAGRWGESSEVAGTCLSEGDSQQTGGLKRLHKPWEQNDP